MHRMMTYITTAIRPAPLPPAIRTRDADWQELSPLDRRLVEGYFNCEWPLSAVSLAGQTFVRRHHKEDV